MMGSCDYDVKKGRGCKQDACRDGGATLYDTHGNGLQTQGSGSIVIFEAGLDKGP